VVSSGTVLSGFVPIQSVGLASIIPTTTKGVDVTLEELSRCAAHMGDGSMLPITGSSARSLVELLWRIGMVRSAVQLSDGHWKQTAEYQRLDGSEKSAVSYFLGMVQATIVAQELLGTPYLVHVDAALKAIHKPSHRKRPDLVGYCLRPTTQALATQGRLLVEAKGRSGAYDPKAVGSARKQLGKTTPSTPSNPAMALLGSPANRLLVASEAYFDVSGKSKRAIGQGFWCSYLEDPPSPETGNQDLSDDDFCSLIDFVHYLPVISAVRQLKELRLDVTEHNGWVRAALPGAGVVVDISSNLWDVFEENGDGAELTAGGRDALSALRNKAWPVDAALDQPASGVWRFSDATSPVRYWLRETS